jgi:phage-related protein
MQGLTVGIAVYRHGLYTHFAGAAHHPEGDLSAVRNKDFMDFWHRGG